MPTPKKPRAKKPATKAGASPEPAAGSAAHVKRTTLARMAAAWRSESPGWTKEQRETACEALQAEFGSDAFWLIVLARDGDGIVGEAVADVIAAGGPDMLSRSWFSELGKAVARAAQRRILLRQLKLSAWNLSHAARALEMGTEATPVLRAIRELNLVPEYEQAKRDMGIVGGGHRAPPDEK